MNNQTDVITKASQFTPEQQTQAFHLGLSFGQVNEQLDAGLTVQQIFLIAEWEQSKVNASHWKAEELRLRVLVQHCGITTRAEGTNRADIGGGMELKSVIKYSYKLDPDVKLVQKVLAKLPDHLAERLVSWKPNFYPGVYKEMQANDDMKRYVAIMDEIVTTEEATGTLEIVPASKRK